MIRRHTLYFKLFNLLILEFISCQFKAEVFLTIKKKMSTIKEEVINDKTKAESPRKKNNGLITL